MGNQNSEEKILFIPFGEFRGWIEGFNTTERDDRTYWHVRIHEKDGKYRLTRKQGFDSIDLGKYLISSS